MKFIWDWMGAEGIAGGLFKKKKWQKGWECTV
jgi:hypothetical protein